MLVKIKLSKLQWGMFSKSTFRPTLINSGDLCSSFSKSTDFRLTPTPIVLIRSLMEWQGGLPTVWYKSTGILTAPQVRVCCFRLIFLTGNKWLVCSQEQIRGSVLDVQTNLQRHFTCFTSADVRPFMRSKQFHKCCQRCITVDINWGSMSLWMGRCLHKPLTRNMWAWSQKLFRVPWSVIDQTRIYSFWWCLFINLSTPYFYYKLHLVCRCIL
jgi:hypothetical protein